MELFDDCKENSYAIDPDFEQCQAVYSSDSEYACEVVILIHFISIAQHVLCHEVDELLIFEFGYFILRTFGKTIAAST